MRTYKKDLPAGVRKKFITKIGRKYKIINKSFVPKSEEK